MSYRVHEEEVKLKMMNSQKIYNQNSSVGNF